MTTDLAYYNDVNPYVAQWTRNLISAGHITKGVVDERSILEVTAADLEQFTRVNMFSGIAIWDLALNMAGWPLDREVWTGSCPCQPFSIAGRREGMDDERHLWPEWYRLIKERRPLHIFGEQVASKDGLAWFDTVQADLEKLDYTVGMVVSPAAGFGAPHIRERLYFVAHSPRVRWRGGSDGNNSWEGRTLQAERSGRFVLVGDPEIGGDRSFNGESVSSRERQISSGRSGPSVELGDSSEQPRSRRSRSVPREEEEVGGENGPQHGDRTIGSQHAGQVVGVPEREGLEGHAGDGDRAGRQEESGPTPETGSYLRGPANGFWAGAEWIYCTDEKLRPFEPGVFPLAYGDTKRVERLSAYGNAIVAPHAAEFIRAYMLEVEIEPHTSL